MNLDQFGAEHYGARPVLYLKRLGARSVSRLGFAGENYSRAVVENATRRVLTRWDEQVAHHDVAVDAVS